MIMTIDPSAIAVYGFGSIIALWNIYVMYRIQNTTSQYVTNAALFRDQLRVMLNAGDIDGAIQLCNAAETKALHPDLVTLPVSIKSILTSSRQGLNRHYTRAMSKTSDTRLSYKIHEKRVQGYIFYLAIFPLMIWAATTPWEKGFTLIMFATLVLVEFALWRLVVVRGRTAYQARSRIFLAQVKNHIEHPDEPISTFWD